MMRRVVPSGNPAIPSTVVATTTTILSSTRSFASIPKEAYDPMRHNPKWYDSYGKKMSQRRIWPSKKYSVGLEPETPTDWLKFSKRNLAYQYNGAMRSKNSFPELVPLYQEMKERGVQVDIDTMFIMLSRASRYEKLHVEEIFSLFQEMVDLGARPDIAIAELMQTVLQHHLDQGSAAWREVRRQELIALYVQLAAEDVAAYGDKGLESLMKQQFQRYRHNILTLGGQLPEKLWMSIIGRLTLFDDVMEFTGCYLWDFVPVRNHKKLAVPIAASYPLEVPQVHFALKRPTFHSGTSSSSGEKSSGVNVLDKSLGIEATPAASGDDKSVAAATTNLEAFADFPEDHAINQVYLAGLQRIITFPLKYNGRQGRKIPHDLQLRLYYTLAQRAGFFLSNDVIAQLMDCAKYLVNDVATHGCFDSDHEGVNQSALCALGCQPQDTRPEAGVYGQSIAATSGALGRGAVRKLTDDQDKLAVRLIGIGVKGSDYFEDPSKGDWAYYNKTKGTEVYRDPRVIGRYLAARDPWSSRRFSLKNLNGKIEEFPVKGGVSSPSSASATEGDDKQVRSVGEGGDETAAAASDAPDAASSSQDAGPGASSGLSKANTVVRTADDVEMRWDDLKALIANTKILELKPSAAFTEKYWDAVEGVWTPMEVFTGQALFLGKMVAGLPGASRGMVGSGASAEVVLIIQEKLVELHATISEYLVQANEILKLADDSSHASRIGVQIAPEVQCWESMLATATTLMDSLARLNTKTESGVQAKEAAFGEVSALRAKLVAEAKNNWGGKFAILWLEQA